MTSERRSQNWPSQVQSGRSEKWTTRKVKGHKILEDLKVDSNALDWKVLRISGWPFEEKLPVFWANLHGRVRKRYRPSQGRQNLDRTLCTRPNRPYLTQKWPNVNDELGDWILTTGLCWMLFLDLF